MKKKDYNKNYFIRKRKKRPIRKRKKRTRTKNK